MSLPLFDEDGNVVFIAGSTRNITKRQQTAEALKESEERFRNLADQVLMFIYLAEADAQVTYWNKTWLEYTGTCFEDALGLGWSEVIHPDDFDSTYTTFVSNFENKTVYTQEHRLRGTDDHYRWFLSKNGPRYLPNGEFAGFIGTIIDINEQTHH